MYPNASDSSQQVYYLIYWWTRNYTSFNIYLHILHLYLNMDSNFFLFLLHNVILFVTIGVHYHSHLILF